MQTLIIVVTSSIGVAGLCSLFEAVLHAVSPTHASTLEEEGRRVGLWLRRLRSQVDLVVAILALLRTLALTAGSLFAGMLSVKWVGEQWLVAFVVAFAALALLGAHLVPQTVANRWWRRLLPLSVYSMTLLVLVLRPLGHGVLWVHRALAKGGDEDEFDRREIESLARIGLQRGSLSEHEVRGVSNLLSLDSVKVSEVMTPRAEIVGLPVQSSLEQARSAFVESGFSRLVVYDGDLEDVRGTLTVAALLRAEAAPAEQRGGDLSQWLRPVRFIPATRTISNLLTGFRRSDDAVAIVLDEFGATKGLVTLHDLLEEIVGEIYEGSEGSEEPIQPMGRGRFRLAGRLSLRELAQRLDVQLEADADTVAGFVMDRLGRMAEPGDVVVIEEGRLVVEKVEERRLESLVLERSAGRQRPRDEGVSDV